MYLRIPLIQIVFIAILVAGYAAKAYSYDPLYTDEEARALHDLQSVFGSDREPESFKREGSERPYPQDATMIIMDIQRNWGHWRPAFREIAGRYFLAKPTSFQALPPDGRGENVAMSKVADLSAQKIVRVGHLLPNWVETANFSIEWGNNLNSSDGGKDSSRILNCSKRAQGLPCTGIPDIVDSWADYFEEVWGKEIENLGYVQPTGTENYLYDIYIANTADRIAGNDDDKTPSLGYNFLGLTATYCANENSNPICKENMSSAYSYIIVNNSVFDADRMKVTSAHEFFHAIQFSYPTIDDWFSLQNRWWIESTATWMEDVAYDDVNMYYSRIRSWLKNPSLSLKYSGNNYAGHEYGDAIFVIFYTDVYLKDRDFVRYVWENENSGLEALNNVLMNRYNSDFESAFKEFVSLNAVADIGETRGGYEEGPEYGRAAVTKAHDAYPIPVFEVNGAAAPQELGSNYVQFTPPDNKDNRLVIEFDGSDSDNWAAMVVKVRSDGTGFEREEMALNPLLKYGCYSVEGFGTTYNEIFLVPAVLVDPDLSETAPYRYSALLNDTCSDKAAVYLSPSDSQSTPDHKTDNNRCFIATAAFGSPGSPFVKILRDFRDEYLIPYSLGKRFVELYYTLSPSLAEFIEHHPPAPLFVRIALLPVIGIAFLLIKTTLLEKMTLILIFLYIRTRPSS